MPRIDPLQLLKCLSVLLTPECGILSRDEVPRLVNLMTKFSKKLVSKCVYVLILKSTETELVDMFMAEGGWALIQTWLQDAVQTANWDLVKEILGLLLITPVDVERLKLNILPKLIKSLSRREDLEGVAELSTKLVHHWLVIVKGSNNPVPQQTLAASEKIEISQSDPVVATGGEPAEHTEEQTDLEPESVSPDTFYKSPEKESKRKVSVEDQDAVASAEEDKKVEEEKTKSSSKNSRSNKSSGSSGSRDKERSKENKERSRDKEKSRDRDNKDKSKDKDRKVSSRSSSSSSKHRSSGSTEDRDKDRKNRERSDRDKDKDKYKNKSNGSLKSSSGSSSSREKSKENRDKAKDKDVASRDKDAVKDKPVEKEKENQAEKDKDTLAAIKPPTIDKLGRIPKKSSAVVAAAAAAAPSPTEEEQREAKKKAFSVGIRKDREERPKTVKIFNSKMRSTGLEEEVKPAPARPVKKPTPSLQLPTIPMKRPSPPRDPKDPIVPPEKKLRMDKVDLPDRPGAIKLIPPKPKPALLQESDLFMDAITAATTKKEPKKRKRRLSVTKETGTTSPSSSPSRDQPQTPTSPTQTGANTSPLGLKNIAPINFYQDTLAEEKEENPEASENAVAAEEAEEKTETAVEPAEQVEAGTIASPPTTPTDDNQEEEETVSKRVRVDGGLRGVLLYTKKKGPKRSISWKNETELVEIRYFELDETERVNVTKTFGDMAKMDISSEREALQLSRKVGGEDLMEAQIMWRIPFVIEQEDPLAVPGHKSLEKDIQFAREKSVLQALYFDKRRIPDSPDEPIPENHQMSDPIHIPLEDPESQEMDLRGTPWPEPKGMAPLPEPVMPPMFPSMQGPYNNPQFNNMPPPAFQGMPPRFPGPGGPMGPAVPNNFVPPNVMPVGGNMMGPGQNHPNHPNMLPPNEMMMNQMNPINQMNPNMFPPGPVNDNFAQGPEFPMFGNPNGPPNMFPPNNFQNNHRPNNRGGGGGFRRGNGNNGNWVRMNGGGGNWRRGGRGGRLCKNVQNHGYCRNRDNCPFVHP